MPQKILISSPFPMRNTAMVGDISAQERLMVICGEEAALRKAASEILEKIQQDAHLEDRQTGRQTMG